MHVLCLQSALEFDFIGLQARAKRVLLLSLSIYFISLGLFTLRASGEPGRIDKKLNTHCIGAWASWRIGYAIEAVAIDLMFQDCHSRTTELRELTNLAL
jgi:hypothetical protein